VRRHLFCAASWGLLSPLLLLLLRLASRSAQAKNPDVAGFTMLERLHLAGCTVPRADKKKPPLGRLSYCGAKPAIMMAQTLNSTIHFLRSRHMAA